MRWIYEVYENWNVIYFIEFIKYVYVIVNCSIKWIMLLKVLKLSCWGFFLVNYNFKIIVFGVFMF